MNDRERTQELLGRFEEGRLTAEEERELAARLRADPAARQALAEQALFSAAIAAALARPQVRAPAPAPPPRGRKARWGALGLGAGLLATAAAAFVLGRPAEPPAGGGEDAGRGATVQSLVLVHAAEAEARARGPALEGAAPGASGSTGAAAGPRPEARRPPPRFVTAAADDDAPEGDRPLPSEALRGVPPALLARQRAWSPDARGLYLWNQTAFQCAGYQRFGLDTLLAGALLGRRDWIEEAWGVVETTFAHQTPAGNFGTDGPACVSSWLAPLVVALEALAQSPLAADFAARARALDPAIARAAAFVAAPPQRPALLVELDHRPQMALVGAAALAGAGRRLGDPRLVAEARLLADAGLARLRDDGGFDHLGGEDLAFHAERLLHLHWLVSSLPTPAYVAAARTAGAWLLARVGDSARLEVFGPVRRAGCARGAPLCGHAPYREMRWAALFHAVRFDAAALTAAERLWERELGEARRQ